MSPHISLTPLGRLNIVKEAGLEPGLDDGSDDQLITAFSESSAEGLLQLASIAAHDSLPPTLTFWRQFSLRYLQAVCSMGESVEQRWNEIIPPDETELTGLVAAAPPMRGLEYLTVKTLQDLWEELHALTQVRAKQFPDGTIAYLRQLNPAWQLLGRVNFHLAENKRDEQRPFAFLATYTHRLASGSRMKHLPLAEALKEYAGAKNLSQLNALLEPVRRAATESPLVQELLETKDLFQPQVWNIRQAHRFLVEVPRMEAAGLVVRVPDWWNPRRPSRPQVQVRLGGKQTSEMGAKSLLDFEVDLALEGEPLTQSERDRLLQATEGLVLLRGRWVEVDQEKLQQALTHWEQLQREHPDGLGFIQGMRSLAGAQLEEQEDSGEVADWSQIVAGDWLKETLQTLRDPRGMTLIQPGQDLNATLRPYQDEGVRWLWFMLKLGLGACLADDMGLGKTIQVIALLLQLKRESANPVSGKGDGKKRSPRSVVASTAPSLLIVPSSLVGNWKQELQKFGPQLRVFYAHRSECDPETLKQIAENPRDALSEFDLMVTTYGFARRSDWLSKVDWRLLILDEAQAIKNATAAQTKAVKKLPASGRVVLTGTPVENHLGDLWSLFEFCCPGLLGSAAQFKKYVKRLNQQKDGSGYGSLRRLVRPYILRRLKTDPHVVPDLPEKTEMHVECGLSKFQAALYEKAVKDLKKRLESADGIARRGLVLSTLMQLKQICNHPSQYLGDSNYSPKESGKFERLNQICEPILERQEKMLVFTQFQTVCEPLAEYLASLFGQPGLVLHGKTPVKRRTELVRAFQADGGPPFFVISVKAGGSGLNLTAASHVIHFDRWWNPAVENQATDRAFRIGQKRNVLVHKFVCRGTLEERIDQMIQGKRSVSENLLDQSGETLLTELSDDELLRFVSIDMERAMADE